MNYVGIMIFILVISPLVLTHLENSFSGNKYNNWQFYDCVSELKSLPVDCFCTSAKWGLFSPGDANLLHRLM